MLLHAAVQLVAVQAVDLAVERLKRKLISQPQTAQEANFAFEEKKKKLFIIRAFDLLFISKHLCAAYYISASSDFESVFKSPGKGRMDTTGGSDIGRL